MIEGRAQKKRTFLDTGVLISAFRGVGEVAEKAFEIIDDPDREFFATDFFRIELLPKPTFNKQQEAVDFYNSYLASVIECLRVTPEITERALGLACSFNLGPVDAIHFQSAIEMNISEFITTEKPTKPYFQINHQIVKTISIAT